MEIERLKIAIERIEDPRRTDRGHVLHKLEDIIIIGMCTLVCNGSDFADMEDFGREREEWLRNFLELPNGIPDSDTFRRVFERLDPKMLAQSLYDWLANNRKDGNVIAIDGKTICGSGNQTHKAYHVVSAFVAENQITLGELMTEKKSNEITAVPELLEMLEVNNSIITADAMNCQKEIVKTITGKKADYVIALKRNQPGLLENAVLYFDSFRKELSPLVTNEKDHGRIEKREYRLLTDLSWLPGQKEWSGLKSVGEVQSTVTRNGETTTDTRYFISSLTDLSQFAHAVRCHWSIENQLHWCLDVIFDEDGSRARKDMSPLNLNVLRKVALSLCKNCQNPKLRKSSLQKRRFRASLNPETFLSILLGT